MIESLTNIMDAKKRFPDLPPDHVQHLCYISHLIFNGATWDKVVQRRNLNYLELGMLLMPLDADDIQALQAQGEKTGMTSSLKPKKILNRPNGIKLIPASHVGRNPTQIVLILTADHFSILKPLPYK